jgi:hypothetical protein
MDINSFLNNVAGMFVASIPTLISILSTVGISLGRIRSTTNSFPETVSALKTELLNLFGASAETLETAFLKSTAEFSNMLVVFKSEMQTLVASSVKQITEGVNDALVGMKKELTTFNKFLESNRDHINLVAVESKLYIDVILGLVAKEPQLVRDGVASILSARLNRTKEELENFPLNLVTNPVAFENAMKEVLLTIGREKFEEMLRNAGYAKTQTL